jgi:hypothetical protein
MVMGMTLALFGREQIGLGIDFAHNLPGNDRNFALQEIPKIAGQDTG